jgi:hypothetical protein
MAEKLKTEQKGFNVWKNPGSSNEPIRFMGEVYPPNDQGFLTGSDLRELGLGPGRYSVLAPPEAPHSNFFQKWQSVVIPND